MNYGAWDGLGSFALATGIYATLGGSTDAALAAGRADAARIAAASARSIVGYEGWEDDPARVAAAATVKSLSALIDTTGTRSGSDAGATGVSARRSFLGARELTERFRRRFGETDAQTAGSAQQRFRHHHVGSLRNPRPAGGGRPSPGTIGDAQNPDDQ